MKKVIGIVILAATLFMGCAKANDPYKDTSYTIDKIYPTMGEPVDFVIGPDKIYIAEDQGGFSIYDKSNGTKYFGGTIIYPQGDPATEIPYHLTSVQFINYSRNSNYIFVYNRDNTTSNIIYFLDITDPTRPIYKYNEIGGTYNIKDMFFYNTPSPGYQDRFATINPDANGSKSYLRISDFLSNDPYSGLPNSNQNFVLNLFTELKGLDIVDSLAYIATSQTGVQVYDTNGETLPITPPLLGFIDTPGDATKLKVAGNYIYVADKQAGLQVIDKSNLLDMKIVYNYDTVGYAESIAIEGNRLVVGSGGGGAYVFDISNPAQPKLLTNIPTNVLGYVNKVLIDDGFVYVASRDKGIVKIKI